MPVNFRNEKEYKTWANRNKKSKFNKEKPVPKKDLTFRQSFYPALGREIAKPVASGLGDFVGTLFKIGLVAGGVGVLWYIWDDLFSGGVVFGNKKKPQIVKDPVTGKDTLILPEVLKITIEISEYPIVGYLAQNYKITVDLTDLNNYSPVLAVNAKMELPILELKTIKDFIIKVYGSNINQLKLIYFEIMDSIHLYDYQKEDINKKIKQIFGNLVNKIVFPITFIEID